jgi:hypothetical protein
MSLSCEQQEQREETQLIQGLHDACQGEEVKK